MKINIYEPKLNIYEKPFKLLYVIIVNMAEAIQKKTRTRKTKAASLAEVQEALYASVQAAAVEAEAIASAHEVAAQEVAVEVAETNANEVAVAAFLSGELAFLGIVEFVEEVLQHHLATNFVSDQDLTIEEVLKAADWAQQYGRELLDSKK